MVRFFYTLFLSLDLKLFANSSYLSILPICGRTELHIFEKYLGQDLLQLSVPAAFW